MPNQTRDLHLASKHTIVDLLYPLSIGWAAEVLAGLLGHTAELRVRRSHDSSFLIYSHTFRHFSGYCCWRLYCAVICLQLVLC